MFYSSSYYLKHRGIFINLTSLVLFFTIQYQAEGTAMRVLEQSKVLHLVLFIALLLEPWATKYSMGVLNQRRIEQGIAPIFLHRSTASILGLVYWGGRVALYAVLLLTASRLFIPESFFENKYFIVPFFFVIMIREGIVVFYMASKKPCADFKEKYDFLADIILAVLLFFGEILVKEIFADLGWDTPNSALDFLGLTFPLVLFFVVFYLPIRYIHTIEDFTFARSQADFLERTLSFVLVFLSFLIAQ